MSLFTLILLLGILHGNLGENSDHSESPLKDIPICLHRKTVAYRDTPSLIPANETRCQLESGDDASCPLADAVCCNNQLHCCPHGYTCDVEKFRCVKGLEQAANVVCPGGQMSCADGETCFKSQSGDYSCCPLPDGVSCKDSNHCCPAGYRCDIEGKRCENEISIPWFEKKAAVPTDLPSKLILEVPLYSTPSTVRCSDEKSVCPEETSCCELKNNSYGCCPFRRGSCCSDKIHCCAEGYSCDESGSRCVRHLSLIPLSILNEQTCPDGITKCSSSSTCCPHKIDGSVIYSCCPFAQGVCCGSNDLNVSSCCPQKYTCDANPLLCQLDQTIAVENQTVNQSGSLDNVHEPNEVPGTESPDTCFRALCCTSPMVLCPRTNVCCQSGHCDPVIPRCV